MPHSSEEFLLKEYESAIALTNHVDDVRNNLTNFFLVFAGVAVGAVGLFVTKSSSGSAGLDPRILAATSLVGVTIIGLLFVAVLARLRRVQLERYQIVSRLRKHFLTPHDRCKLIGLGSGTLPKEIDRTEGSFVAARLTGTYLWLATLMFTNSSMAAFASFLFAIESAHARVLCAATTWLVLVVVQDVFYFRLARLR